jgi:hypothetical protein
LRPLDAFVMCILHFQASASSTALPIKLAEFYGLLHGNLGKQELGQLLD